jgi:hypothetical protein
MTVQNPQRLNADFVLEQRRYSPISLAIESLRMQEFIMNSKSIELYKKTLKLSEIQKSILVGLLLGDGHLETQNKGRTYRLKVEHAAGQADYTEWIFEQFKEWIPGGVYRKSKYGREYVGISSVSHGALRFYAQQFYVNGKKRIPPLIAKLTKEVSLAVWFMDDGSWKSGKHRTFIIHALGYSRSELEMMQKVLLEKFDITTSVHRQKKKYWRLYILSKSANDFRKIIEPYANLFLSMRSKMGNVMPKM